MSGMVGNTLSAGNQDSPIGAIAEPIQKWTDPLSWITGGKWADITSKDLPKATNEALQPIAQPINQLDQAVNPLRRIGLINNIANTAYAKPGDAIGLAIGSIASGGALDGALAGAGGGGAGAAGAAGAGAADAGLGAGAGLAADGAGTLAIGAPAAGVGAADGLGTAGATGFTGFMGGGGALGDAGLTGGVSASGSGLGAATAGDMGGALGTAPTGLFSGLLPGGGMSATSSGALGGGLSGAAAGGDAVGGASMGGFMNNPLYSKLSDFAQNQAISQGMKMATPQQQSGYQPQNFSHGASYHAQNAASYMPTSAITMPYTLGGGGVQSLLQQMMQQRQNPLG